MKPVRHSLSALRRTHGFTLIELLVVIAIIGILAAILIPSYAGAQKRPYDTASLQCGKAIVAAQVTYTAEHQGNAAGSLSQLNNGDVTEQCQNIQVALSSKNVNTVTQAGDGNIDYNGSDYAFDIWSQSGSSVYLYHRNAPTQHMIKIN